MNLCLFFSVFPTLILEHCKSYYEDWLNKNVLQNCLLDLCPASDFEVIPSANGRIQQQMSPTCCSDFQTKPCHIGCALHSSTFTTHLNHLNVQDVDGVLNRYIQGTPELDPKLLRNLRRTVDNTNAVPRQWIIRLGTETLLLFLNSEWLFSVWDECWYHCCQLCCSETLLDCKSWNRGIFTVHM